MKTSRPAVLTLAALLLGLLSLSSLATPLLVGPPLPVKVLAVVTGLIGLLAAYGLWQAKRWGMIIAIIVQTRDAHRQSEALRAALGLTLRGATVEVVVDEPLLTPLAERSAATLRSFGYPVGTDLTGALTRASAIEVWT